MDGYPRLARLIGQKPEVAIFRRFGTLNAENLLFLQAELLTLERELRDIVTDDLTSDDEQRKSYSSSWWALKESSESKTADQAQWQKRKEMREKLKEYSIQFPALLSLLCIVTIYAYFGFATTLAVT